MSALFVSIAILLVVCFALVMAIGSITYRRAYKSRYDILSNFPFEMIKRPDYSPAIWYAVVVLTSLLESFLFSSTMLCDVFAPVHDLGILIIVLSIGFSLSQSLIFFIPAHNVKSHIKADVLYFCISILLLCLGAIVFMNMRRFDGPVAFTFMGIMFFYALAVLLIILNPKMGNWAALVATQEKDGTIVTKRPRPFVLAFSEWLIVFIDLAGAVTFTFGVIYFVLNYVIV